MASFQIKKGSPEAQFFSEFLMFRQKYYQGENADLFWEELTNATSEITEKYSKESFGEFARMIVMDHLADVETRFKREG